MFTDLRSTLSLCRAPSLVKFFFFRKTEILMKKSVPAPKHVSFRLRSLVVSCVEPVNTLGFVEPEK